MTLSIRSFLGGALSLFVALAIITASGSHADDSLYNSLFEQLATAPTEQEGRAIESDIWQYWFNQSPTPEIRVELDKGMERRRIYDLEGAEQHFSNIIERIFSRP